MAHQAEPMDIDDVGDFDNKENTYQHTNVLPKTPSTEKGYEELDVSELNMKLRYSITPAASPMSKSMSHCLDNRQNNLTDESLNNTVINEYENNLTRSLNSTLNKTEVKLPLQVLLTDVDGNRSSVFQPFDSTIGNDMTITVSNENEIDNVSFPSSSSSMAQTPEATTPTKEIPKHDRGSPIMRGLMSVLSMFRSSQSPIPPEEEDPRLHPAVSPADVPLPESKPRAIASTPKSENSKEKEKSISRRNSPHKESIVFNEDLEKELQWNDDSTIVFSTEKIPIHKLFFQDKPSKSTILTENDKQEDANSTVEYMDVSYNDLSINESTLNGTVNKSRVNDLAESDGEFVDCETTFTQNESLYEEPDANKIDDQYTPNAPEKESLQNTAAVKKPFILDTTKDIINSIDGSHIVVEDLEKPLDFSTTDIVNQLSDLINESETSASNVISIENKNTIVLDKPDTVNENEPILSENQVTSTVNIVTDFSAADLVSNENENSLVHTSGIVCHTIVPHLVSVEPNISLAPVDSDVVKTHEVAPQIQCSNETEIIKVPQETCDNGINYPSPVDIPLPIDNDINGINDTVDESVCTDLQEEDTLNASTSQNALMAAVDKSIVEATPEVQHTQVEPENEVITCEPDLLPSDVPLPSKYEEDSVNTNIPHEAITVGFDPVQSSVIEYTNISIDTTTPKTDVIKDTVDISITPTTIDLPVLEPKAGSLEADIPFPSTIHPSDVPLSGTDDDNGLDTQNLVAVVAETAQHATETVDNIAIENNSTKLDRNTESTSAEIDKINVAFEKTIASNLTIPEEEHMEISFVESKNLKLSESMTMDVSMVDVNINVEDPSNQPVLCQPESSQIDTQSLKVMTELPKIINDNIVPVLINIANAEYLDQNAEYKQISNGIKLDSDDKIVECLNKDTTLETVGNTGLTVNDQLKVESPHLPTLQEMAEAKIDTFIVDENNGLEIVNSKINAECTAFVSDVVNDLNTTSTTVATVTTADCKEDTVLHHHPEGSKTTINLDSTHKAQTEDKVDEEIILSEGNSPFVSMSAEEHFDPESKKDDFEKIDNPVSSKSNIARSPPISPRIVSKGYNFNFDDIDNINPFATKTKIRMSPPPDAFPNKSLTSDNLNKTEIEPVKSEKDVKSRRKSMPERKKPLIAKRHLNSSVDSTDKSSPKTTPSKNAAPKIFAEIDPKQEQPHSQPESNPQGISSIAPLNDDNFNNDNIDVVIPSEIITHEDKNHEPAATPSIDISSETISSEETVHIEPVPTPSVEHLRDEKASTVDEINITQNTETKVIEDLGVSACSKTLIKQDASSSEQSAYFSAGSSSTELTGSNNVFNLPELDDFNPFATKSKVRQSPTKDFDMDNPFATKSKIHSSRESSFVITPNDCNTTVTIGNADELKEADCSGSSKMSDEKDITVHEVHTEDEDTLEGPFLEADEGIDGENVPELPDDKVDVVDFDNINQQDNDDAAEMFIDAEAFEFLMNQNKTDEVAYSGKESLFLKFDPLFARRVTSEGVAAALNDIKRKQNTPKKAPRQAPPNEVELLSFEKPEAGPSDLSAAQSVIEERPDDMNVTASKPMMAVTPAVNPVVTPRKSLTPNRSNRLSMTFTSPAMAVIDRLLSLSGNSPSAGHDTTVTHADRSHNETDQALTQLRELLAEKEIHVYNLRCETKELKDRLSTLESQMKALEAESAERLKKVNDLNENLAEKTKMNRNMAAVVEEYERTIASLISETEQDKKRFAEDRNQLIRERDEQTAHLASMEVSFNDLHSKYEKSKQVIMGYKTNEEAYRKSIQDFEENLGKMHTNYELLKQHATSKLNHANQELEKINKAHESEILKFNAMLKRKEVHITSLEESLAQKTKANEELTAICDELINKVG